MFLFRRAERSAPCRKTKKGISGIERKTEEGKRSFQNNGEGEFFQKGRKKDSFFLDDKKGVVTLSGGVYAFQEGIMQRENRERMILYLQTSFLKIYGTG
ncbi:hypothetical protein QNI16_17390 [Cytophagaceae bacterium YF14B1]|uniref:Uncharacterized protein n=1 Tax=Xanthocytophaga flava TaxID=3048013 RepID=A0AAE3U9I0_9BACT|nr:hypothetical protein [Xanthocytophaga flavus]MDJ1482283.1 hypothetical protein [Xanthocytophaga flavus]